MASQEGNVAIDNNLSRNGMDTLLKPIATDSISRQHPISRQKRFVGAYVALLLFMFIYFARPEDWIPGLSKVPLAKIAGILALLGLLFSLQHIRRLPREILYLGLLTGQLIIASALSPVWRGGAFQTTLDFAKVLIVTVVMAVAVNTPRRLRLLIFTQAASVAVIGAVTLWKGHLLLGRLEGMLGGAYSDPNDLALSLVISLPLCLALLFLTRSWIWKAAWASAIVVMTFATFLTGSRGGFLSIIVTAGVCLWAFAIRGRRPHLVVLAILLAVIVVLSSGGIIIGRLKGTFNLKEDIAAANGSAQARRALFWRSIEVTKEHPFFGVGPGNFAQLSGTWHVTHNSFTQMSSEGGIPALILYVLVLWSGFKNIRATKRFANRQREIILFAKALYASLVGYVAGSCFLSVNLAFFPYMLVAYTTALYLIAIKLGAQDVRFKSKQRRVAFEAPSEDWSV
jgi:putative inorganic carbon (HCO3(-)) transporter